MAKTNEKDRSVWVGFDLGGTKMLAVVYDSDFNVLGKKRRKTREKKGQSTVPVARITETIRMALNDANVPSDAVHESVPAVRVPLIWIAV